MAKPNATKASYEFENFNGARIAIGLIVAFVSLPIIVRFIVASIINNYMPQCMDGIAALVQQGQTTDEAADQVLGKMSAPDCRGDSRVDTRQVNSSTLAISEPGSTDQHSFDFGNLLEMLRGLQELADKNWWLSTSQLAQVMGLKSLPASEHFERYGFRFTRSGKNGSETALRVEKINQT